MDLEDLGNEEGSTNFYSNNFGSLIFANCIPLSVRDIVLIIDDGPRNYWQLGKNTRLNRSSDNLVKSVVLKTKSGITSWTLVKFVHLDITIFAEKPILS